MPTHQLLDRASRDPAPFPVQHQPDLPGAASVAGMSGMDRPPTSGNLRPRPPLPWVRVPTVQHWAALVAPVVDNDPSWVEPYLAVLPDEASALDLLWADLVTQTLPASECWADWDADQGIHLEAARHAMYLMVAHDGWQRLKRCARDGCSAPFVDRSSGQRGRACVQHRRTK